MTLLKRFEPGAGGGRKPVQEPSPNGPDSPKTPQPLQPPGEQFIPRRESENPLEDPKVIQERTIQALQSFFQNNPTNPRLAKYFASKAKKARLSLAAREQFPDEWQTLEAIAQYELETATRGYLLVKWEQLSWGNAAVYIDNAISIVASILERGEKEMVSALSEGKTEIVNFLQNPSQRHKLLEALNECSKRIKRNQSLEQLSFYSTRMGLREEIIDQLTKTVNRRLLQGKLLYHPDKQIAQRYAARIRQSPNPNAALLAKSLYGEQSTYTPKWLQQFYTVRLAQSLIKAAFVRLKIDEVGGAYTIVGGGLMNQYFSDLAQVVHNLFNLQALETFD